MKRKNKNTSLILIALLTIALPSKQTNAMDPNQVAAVAQNMAGLVDVTQLAKGSWYASIVEFFGGQAAAAIDPVDPLVGLDYQENIVQLYDQSEPAAAVVEAAAITQLKMNLFEDENGLQAWQLALDGKAGPLRKLLEEGANANSIDVNAWNETALISAASRGSAATVNILLDAGADVNAADEFGWTALMHAASRGHSKMVQALLDAGAHISATDVRGDTALTKASNNFHDQIVSQLKAHLDTCKKNIIAPAGLSLPEAFTALYNAAKPLGMGYLDPLVHEPINDDNYAMQVLLSVCGKKMWCDYVHGRPIKIDFDQYPQLNVVSYDRDQGICKAQEVLAGAARIHKVSKRASTQHFSNDVCDYFEHVQSSDELSSDLLPAFEQCYDFTISQQKVAAYKSTQSPWQQLPLSACVASYVTNSNTNNKFFPINKWKHPETPCAEALNHMKLMEQNPAIWITKLRVCATRASNDASIDTLERCEELNQAATTTIATEFLKHAMGEK